MCEIDVSKFPLHECPYCGGKMMCIRQRISGIGEYYVDLESGEIEATELHSRLQCKNTGKYAICADCGKRLFKVDDDLNVLE